MFGISMAPARSLSIRGKGDCSDVDCRQSVSGSDWRSPVTVTYAAPNVLLLQLLLFERPRTRNGSFFGAGWPY
jgi:hypothetical protein